MLVVAPMLEKCCQKLEEKKLMPFLENPFMPVSGESVEKLKVWLDLLEFAGDMARVSQIIAK